jgi:hypothetical protein
VFTPQERDRLRDALVAAAKTDDRIMSVALFGSAALGTADRWSDVDLTLGVAVSADLGQVMADWTDRLYAEHGAVEHLDITGGTTVYRVFLLASTLQVDIAFARGTAFGAAGPAFQLLFGTAHPQPPSHPPEAAELVGLGWLYALHARSSLARGRVWQAEYMISGVRDHVLALACLRCGVPAVQGRGLDSLPPEVTGPIAGALARSVESGELARAFRVAVGGLLAEASQIDASLGRRLAGPLGELGELAG